MLWRLLRRVGRRGIFLLLIGAVWTINGLGIVFEPSPAFGSGQRLVIQNVLPLPFWGWTFVLGGILSIIYAFRGKNDFLGFIGAITPCFFWGSTELVSFLMGTYERGALASVIWLFVACIVMLVASWPEPPSENGNVDAHDLGG
jgi:hypothetical protein